MPDEYEIANGFDINNPDDAEDDADGDGSSNLGEFVAGTIPTDPSSVLAITATSVDGDDIILSFDAVEGKSYSLQSVLDLRSGPLAGDRNHPVCVPGTRVVHRCRRSNRPTQILPTDHARSARAVDAGQVFAASARWEISLPYWFA